MVDFIDPIKSKSRSVTVCFSQIQHTIALHLYQKLYTSSLFLSTLSGKSCLCFHFFVISSINEARILCTMTNLLHYFQKASPTTYSSSLFHLIFTWYTHSFGILNAGSLQNHPAFLTAFQAELWNFPYINGTITQNSSRIHNILR